MNKRQKEATCNLEFDSNRNATLVITCPKCGGKNRQEFRTVKPGTEIACGCGEFVAALSGDDLRQIQSRFRRR